MTRTLLTKSIASLASLGLIAMVAATPASAGWRGPHGGWGGHGHWRGGGGAVAAGIIGGLALGALAASAAQPTYVAPAYGPVVEPEPVYEPVCYRTHQPVYTVDGQYLRDRIVRICE